jgi:hypothetical protein
MKEIQPILNEMHKLRFKVIDNYWLHVLKNSCIFSELNERDEECLKHLENISITEFQDEKHDGFQLNFHFGENEFFKHDILTKTFTKLKEKKTDNLKPKGMKIEWNLLKDLTLQKVKSKKMMPKPCESFFNFFSLEKQNEEKNFIDLDIFEVIKEELLPNSFKYYMGTEEPIDILSNEKE